MTTITMPSANSKGAVYIEKTLDEEPERLFLKEEVK